MQEIKRVIQQGIDDRWHYGAQIYVAKGAELLLDEASGTVDGHQPLSRQHVISWMSCSKMIVAMAIAKLYDEGLLGFDTKVGDIIPEFATKGKEDVTLKHILTHMCGFRDLPGLWKLLTRDTFLEKIYALPLEPNWQIGVDAGYHAQTSFMILGEVIYRLTDQYLEDFIREHFFQPLGMENCFFGEVPLEASSLLANFYVRDEGANTLSELPDKYLESSCPCKPGGSGRGPINQFAKFMQMIKDGGAVNGCQVIKSSTINLLLERHREGVFDKSFQKIIDWGLGFMCSSNMYSQKLHPYSFGQFASKNTFGHCGIQTSTSYIDFDNDLLVCLNFNGMPGELNHYRRLNSINEAIYKDLGITKG